mgnify:CR=1 FL=1
MCMPSLENLSYYAGFFDGEGSVSINYHLSGRAKSPSYQLRTYVTNANPIVIYQLQAAFDGSIRIRPSVGNHKTYYVWTTFGPKAAKFLEAIQPHLRLKVEQCQIGIEFQKLLKSLPSKRKSVNDLAKLEVFKRQIHVLNKRGVY